MEAKISRASKNEAFEKNLVAASHVKEPLKQAALEWMFSHLCLAKEKLTQCQLCGTPAGEFVVVANTANRNKLAVGEQCYEKLCACQHTGIVSSVRSARKALYSQLRAFTAKHMGRNKRFQTFLAWFENEPDLPHDIRAAAEFLLKKKIPPSIEAGQRLVAYAREHRIVPRVMALPPEALIRAHNIGMHIPEQLTLQQAEAFAGETQQKEREAADERLRQMEAWGKQLAECNFTLPVSKDTLSCSTFPPFWVWFDVRLGEELLRIDVSGRRIQRHVVVPTSSTIWKPTLEKSLPDAVRVTHRYSKTLDLSDESFEEWMERAKAQLVIERGHEKEREAELLRLAHEKMDSALRERPDKYVKIPRFELKHFNNRPRWEATIGKITYILDRDCPYSVFHGETYAQVTRELVPRKVLLVAKLEPRIEYGYCTWVLAFTGKSSSSTIPISELRTQ